MEKIAIVLLNYKSAKETAGCIDSLSKTNTRGCEIHIYIVDNSPHETGDVIENKIKGKQNIELFKNNTNTGFTGGNNRGIEEALRDGADYILILNNDTLTSPDFLTPLVNTLKSNKKTGVAVPKIYFAKGHEYHKQRYDQKDLGKVIWYAGGMIDWKNVIGKHKGVDRIDSSQFDHQEKTEYATGAAMLVKREAFEKVGLFDEKYFLYYEDADLSVRIKKAGYEIMFQPNSHIWHKNAASSGGSGSDLQDYYITRNRLLFGIKYAPLRSKAALIKESIKHLVKGRVGQKRGVIDFYTMKFGKGSI